MQHITIAVPAGRGNNLSSIVGAYKILTKANEYWKSRYGCIPFKIQLAGVSKRVTYYEGLFTVKPQLHISEIKKTSLIIVPSLNHDYKAAIKQNKPMIEWLRAQHGKGAAIAAICTGTFLLAATGLLEGKHCSTHWAAADQFKAMFPEVRLQPQQLITDEQGIYTNGGAYSFLNLVIYLVEKYYDRHTAIFCSKVFQVEMDRNCQSPFMIFSGQKAHGDQVVEQAQQYIESRVHEKISVSNLSASLASGRRNFDRRFIRATGNTPLEYMQRVKTEAAKKALESTRKTVGEIMYDVGYSDAKAFREVFRKITGLSPLDYKKKYNREMMG